MLGLKPEKVVQSVGTVLDDLITNKEELAAAKLAVGREINRHLEAIAATGLETLREGFKDQASARNREVTLRNTIGVWVQNLAAVMVILSFVGLLFCVIYKQVPTENKELINIMLGALGTIVVQIFQYWFGSSAGSARKQEWFERGDTH